jgi:membrane associated rhomboid family serine protease
MREASVGFQCPECVTEGNRSVRRPRTMAGGAVAARDSVVTLVMIALNVVAFVGTAASGGDNGTLNRWGAMLSTSSFSVESGELLTGVAEGAWWRPVTAAFLHFGVLHLLLNMYALYLFGPMVERSLGTLRYVLTYLTLAVGSSVVVYWLSPEHALTAGASGVVFGLFGFALVLLLKLGEDVRGLLVLLAINGFISLQGGVSWQGHLGGFVTGLLLAGVLALAPRRVRPAAYWVALVLVWTACAVGLVARTAQLTA